MVPSCVIQVQIEIATVGWVNYQLIIKQWNSPISHVFNYSWINNFLRWNKKLLILKSYNLILQIILTILTKNDPVPNDYMEQNG